VSFEVALFQPNPKKQPRIGGDSLQVRIESFEVALFSVIQTQQAKWGRKWTAILYKPKRQLRENVFLRLRTEV
jgi:hypothetical protein